MRQMSAEKTTEFVPVNFLPAKVDCERRADGAIALRSPEPLRDYPRRIGGSHRESLTGALHQSSRSYLRKKISL